MPEGDSTRDRVRALVREVLNNAAPAEESDAPDARGSSRDAASAQAPRTNEHARARR